MYEILSQLNKLEESLKVPKIDIYDLTTSNEWNQSQLNTSVNEHSAFNFSITNANHTGSGSKFIILVNIKMNFILIIYYYQLGMTLLDNWDIISYPNNSNNQLEEERVKNSSTIVVEEEKNIESDKKNLSTMTG